MPPRSQRIQSTWRRRLPRLLREVGQAATPKAVHRLRTTIRRVEAEVRLGKPWRRLRRQAGAVRDLDVQVALLRQLHLASDGGRRELAEALAAERMRRAAKLSAGLSPKRRRKLTARLLAADAPEAVGAAAVQAEFATMDRRFPTLTTENLHGFRKACKRLRYRAEAAGATALAAEFERMQDAIGAWHDWRQLTLRATGALAGRPAGSLFAALENASAVHWVEALRTTAATRAGLRSSGARRPPGTAPRLVAVATTGTRASA